MVLQKQMELLSGYLEQESIKNESVSVNTINWHIHHSLLVIIGIIRQLEQSNPKDYRWQFSLPRMVIFAKGKLPRGVGRAPKQVKPESTLSKSELANLLDVANQELKKIERLTKKAHFAHPYFKELNKKQSVYFLKLHTVHHIEIIKDILK